MTTSAATDNGDTADVERLVAELALQRRLIDRLRREREAERASVAHAVHDTIGQTLSAMKMQLHESARNATLADATRDRLRELEEHVDALLMEARRIASALRPGVLDHFGFASALEAALDRFGRENGVDATLECETRHGPRLPADTEVGLLRIAEMALDNVAAHAQASEVRVIFHQGPDAMDLVVRDDGRGFDLAALEPEAALGLLDMRTRTEALGGRLHIESAPGRGTTLRVHLPAQANDSKEAAR